MQIAFHIGANCTEADKLLKSTLRNTGELLQHKVTVPGPSRYRKLIRETIASITGSAPSADTRDILIDSIVEDDDIERIVMSNDNFMCVPNRIFDDALLYSQAPDKVRALTRLFPDDEIEIFLTIRHPVTFLQETFARSSQDALDLYLGQLQVADIKWSELIYRIKRTNPDVALTVWCNEDSPLLWPQIIRAMTGMHADFPIKGEFEMLSSLISRDGMKTLQQNLEQAAPDTDAARHEIIADIWDAHALPDRIEDEIDLPDLDEDQIAQLTESYDTDVAEISQIEGVRMLLPFT